MKSKMVKRIALFLAAATAALSLAACGGAQDESAAPASEAPETAEEAPADTSEPAGDADTQEEAQTETADEDIPVDTFSYLISVGVGTDYIDSYNDSPALNYWESKPYVVDGEKRYIDLDVWEGPTGSENEYLNNLLATGEYPDVFAATGASMKPTELFEEGITIDITDYVEKYMPNYLAWAKANNYYDMLTNDVNGERRFIQLYQFSDIPGNMWGGYMYRRDWIIKYGKNPETGEAFTGDWEGDEWVDDVVFPSGNTDPVYISDWEWMLDIFQTALDDLGVEDGYAFSLPYWGINPLGDFVGGFGGGGSFYINDDGECVFGVTEDHTKAFLECMQAWWEKGWIDPYFDEHTQDMFFAVDAANVYAGKVGAFYGLQSQLGNVMSTDSGDPSDGALVFGAPQPINDIYGTAADQGRISTVYYGGDLVGESVVVTNKASEKHLATLFTALDALYDEEGGMLRQFGLSKEQQEEFQSEVYNENGLENGAYEKVENADGSYTYKISTLYRDVDGLQAPMAMYRIAGMTTNAHVDWGYADYMQHSISVWTEHPATGNIPMAVTGQMTAEQSAESSSLSTNLITYISQESPKFIRGEKSLDTDWDEFVSDLNEFGPDSYCDIINGILGK